MIWVEDFGDLIFPGRKCTLISMAMTQKARERLSQDQDLFQKRHSLAHVMAEAVMEIFPQTQVAIGPPVEDGFYYDFQLPRALKVEDLPVIEEKMRSILATGSSFIREVVTKAEAEKVFHDQQYKLEILSELDSKEEISLFRSSTFVDLCRGPHVGSMSAIDPGSFKLARIAGAYWRGDEKRPQLTRIYAYAFHNAEQLKDYEAFLVEVEKRDHRRIGKELDLFSTHEEAGPGLIYWHPKGARMRVAIEDYWRKKHTEAGYEIVYTPHVGKSWLWETSGHLGFYKENMFQPMEMDKSDYYAKPMNCPFHILIYKTAMRSYRDLPFRWAELGTVYRYEKSGVLHGLLRVRGFTQDDAHIFCTPDQAESEIEDVLKFAYGLWTDFGFSDIQAYIATKPEKAVGREEDWDKATAALIRAADKMGIAYEMDEGGGAFYGPKIDLKVRDAIGREWQMSTVQFDFNLPERFDMTFIDSDGKEHRPFMVHRALMGSLERFFGVLIEHYGGAFPVWIAPVQAVVIPVAAAFEGYAKDLAAKLKALGFRVDADLGDDRMNAKIRNAQNLKVPYMLVVGGKEAEGNLVSIRTRNGAQENLIPFDAFAQKIKTAVDTKALE